MIMIISSLTFLGILKHLDAKYRWIVLGFHDPDIAILNRSVPTPETYDVPVVLQFLASLQADAWIGDLAAAFTQGIKRQRPVPLFCSPPPGGVPGEEDDILIELIAEVYGLITGPPGWRISLFTAFKELEFKRHPMAPCLALMHEPVCEQTQVTGLILIETDDLFGGGIGDKYHNAVAELRKRFKFGKCW